MTYQEAYQTFSEIFSGKKSATEIEKILLSIEKKGETFEEIAGAAQAMRENALTVSSETETFDVCGTGGSGKNKPFNVSTTVAFVIASQGICMAKHGNRAASSSSGSADVLEELGINIVSTPQEMEQSLKRNSMAFLFAQVLHPAMKTIMPIRKKIGEKTIFNLLGPLTNPSNPSKQVVGVSSKKNIIPMIKALKLIGKKSAIVLHGEDGLDDATICGKTFFARFSEISPEIEEGIFTPEQFGFLPASSADIVAGKNPYESSQIILNILQGKENGARRDIILLNAGIAFHISGKTASIEEGIALAEKAIISGEAFAVLENLRKN